MIEGWRGESGTGTCDLLRKGGGLWQLLMAEEVRLELVGQQGPPSRAMARCKWHWEIILSGLHVGPQERHMGVIRGAWRRGAAMFDINPPSHTLNPPNPSLSHPQPRSSASLCTSPLPGIQGQGPRGWLKGLTKEGP